MKRLIVVGNGFDLSHNLPTQYCNFKCYVKKSDENLYNALCQYIDEDLLWSEFEYALGTIDIDSLREDTSIYLKSYSDDNWSDSYHYDFQYETKRLLSFSENNKISDLLSQWLKETISFDNVYPVFEDYFANGDCICLSFNYTNTLERIYNISPNKILYLHGKLDENDTLICGHNEKYDSHMRSLEDGGGFDLENPKFEEIEDVRIFEAEKTIKNYFERTYKNTITIIKNNIKFFEDCYTLNEIFILGHSLADVDINYFREIAKYASQDCNWNISYHSTRDEKNIKKAMKEININKYNTFKL
jgi:hypothetical protein